METNNPINTSFHLNWLNTSLKNNDCESSFNVALFCSVSVVADRRHVGRDHVGLGHVGPGYVGPGYVGFLGFGNRSHPSHLSIMQSA